ncbi:MAG TPA: helix-turn-helix domain-containing protein [Microlunatus sp.]
MAAAPRERRIGGYVSMRSLALDLAVSTDTVRRWIKDGQLPAVRVGGQIRIRREDAEQLITPVTIDRDAH